MYVWESNEYGYKKKSVGNVVGGDNGDTRLNLYILKSKVSTSLAHISLCSHPIDTYMVQLENQASTYFEGEIW